MFISHSLIEGGSVIVLVRYVLPPILLLSLLSDVD